MINFLFGSMEFLVRDNKVVSDRISVSVYNKALNEHKYSVHDGAKPLKCKICNEEFSRSHQYCKHLTLAHEDKSKISKEFLMCKLFNKQFLVLANLKRHTESVHDGKKSHKCDTCNIVKRARRDLLKKAF